MNTEQPSPIPNDRPSVQDAVIADLIQRKQLGQERYGTPLQPFNGRDANRDAQEEALDLLVYLKQIELERAELIEAILLVIEAWQQMNWGRLLQGIGRLKTLLKEMGVAL